MKARKREYGDCNLIGRNVEKLRKQRGIKQKDFIAKLQLLGVDVNPTSYSKLEGQVRIATDKEVFAIAKVLGVAAGNNIFRLYLQKLRKELFCVGNTVEQTVITTVGTAH